MRWNVIKDNFIKLRRSFPGIIPLFLTVLFSLAVGVFAVDFVEADPFRTPHKDYSSTPIECTDCHLGHTARSYPFLEAATQRETCYKCHDGSKSSFNIRGAFGETVIGSTTKASTHPVTNGTLQCTDCHNPHLNSLDTPRIIEAGEGESHSGSAVCAECHNAGEGIAGSDIVTAIAGTSHDSMVPNPDSGTNIKCVNCHQPHGSPYSPLLKESIEDSDGVLQTITGNNNSVCFGCHTDGMGTYKGKAVYNAVKHGSTSSSTVSLPVYPGTDNAAGYCLNCHEPHGRTGQSKYLRNSGNNLCQKCHDDAAVSRPAAYSYRGIASYNSTPHASAASPPGGQVLYKADAQGFRVWNGTAGQTPSNPGQLVDEGDLAGLLNTDSTWLRTELAALQGDYNSQMYRFKLTEAVASITELRPKWVGYGEPTPGHPTQFLIWNLTLNGGAGGWESISSSQMSTQGTISATKANVTDYVNANREVYFLARALHDGTVPVISSGPTVVNLSTSATISWGTNEPATTWVDYGTTTDYGSTLGSSTLSTSHSVNLTGLVYNVTYNYRFRSADALGNEYVSENRTFHTSNPPPVPTLIAQADRNDGVDTIPVTLSWNPALDPEGETVQYYVEITGNGTTQTSGWISGTSWTVNITNQDYVNWNWRVTARDSWGAQSAWSATDTFLHVGTLTYSCPVVYTWDGEKYQFITDIADASFGIQLAPGKYKMPSAGEPVVIPENKLVPKNGKYTIKLKDELNEIEYIDYIGLQAVDHPIGTSIALNNFVKEREPFKIYTFRNDLKPVKNAVFVNNPVYSGGPISAPEDITALVSRLDNKHVSGKLYDDNQFTFDLGDLSSSKDIKLVVVSWNEYSGTNDKRARVENAKAGRLAATSQLEILQPDGTWKSEKIKHISGHTKTAVIDLNGKFPEGTEKYVVRLRGLYRPHIDFVGVDTSPQAELQTNDLQPQEAELQYAGLVVRSLYPSPTYDYYAGVGINIEHSGNFTRYGDVLPLASKIDDQLVVMDSGDELTVTFDALPPPAEGMTRSFLLKSWLYYKETSTATVDPMPFRAMDMSKYPDLGYPEELKGYVEEWNTRVHDRFAQEITTKDLNIWQKIINKLHDLKEWLTGFLPDSMAAASIDGSETSSKPRLGEPHYSLNANYIELSIDATSDPGMAGACLNCHAVHGSSGITKQLKTSTNNTCFAGGFGCHTNAVNSASGTFSRTKFTGGPNATARHGVDLIEQGVSGTKVDCINCHDPHLNNAANKNINPDNRYVSMSQWTDNTINNYISDDGKIYVLAAAKHDGTPPVISSNYHTVNNALSTATVYWSTNENATRQIEWVVTETGYSGSIAYTNTEGNETIFTSPHSLTFGIASGQDYHYRIKTTDSLGNVSYSGDYTIRISSPPSVPANLRNTPEPLPEGPPHTVAVQLAWDASVDPDNDQVQYYVTGSVGSSGWLPFGQTYWDTSVTNTGTVTFSWQVKARDQYGNESAYSPLAYFTHVQWSCPVIYLWDGQKYQYNTDIAGSAFGMELSPGKYKEPRPGEWISIAENKLIPKDGKYSIKIKAELDEIEYIDNLVLQAVDHPTNTGIGINHFVKDKEPYKIYTFDYDYLKPVQKATYVNNPTYNGGSVSAPKDITELISKLDDRHASGTLFDDNQFTLDLGDLSSSEDIKLVFVGWTEYASEKDKKARVENAKAGRKTAPRLLEIMQPDGTWKTETITFISGHTKLGIIDLKGKFPEGTNKYVVRLRGLYRPHIDYIGVDTSPEAEFKTMDLNPIEAELEYGGMAVRSLYPSPTYDYYKKMEGNLRHEGKFTRYGDVLPLMSKIDDKMVVMDTGDELTLTFEALPPPAPGMTRSFIIKPWVYYKETSTATVDPMPYRGMDMQTYPNLGYPEELKNYINEWNTRVHSKDMPIETKTQSNKNIVFSFYEQLKEKSQSVISWVKNLFGGQNKKQAVKWGPDYWYEKGNKLPVEKKFPPDHYSLNSEYAAVTVSQDNAMSTYLPNSAGSEAWESGTIQTPASLGTPASGIQKDAASVVDAQRWSTNLAGADGFNYQMFKFQISEAKSSVNKLLINWKGYGEPTAGYNTSVSVWNFNTGAWEQKGAGLYATDTTVNFFINRDNAGYCNKCHDNTLPTGVSMGTIPTANISTYVTNGIHGNSSLGGSSVSAPYLNGVRSLACQDCHDRHGSTNVYHLKETVNGRAGISIQTTGGVGAENFCRSCHTGDLVNNWHVSCLQCHGTNSGHDYVVSLTAVPAFANCLSCHGHNKSFTTQVYCDDCHGGTHSYSKTF